MEHKGTITLETERLILRRFASDDAEAMYRNWASDPEVTKFLMWPAHSELAVSEAITKEWSECYVSPDYYQWAIVPKSEGEPIGSIAVVAKNEAAHMVHIGYCIGQQWWHKGYTSEALVALVRFFFEEVGVNRIESRHDPRNPNSGRVMIKAGLKFEGISRQSDHNNQGICDAANYAILAEDYFAGGLAMQKVFEAEITSVRDKPEYLDRAVDYFSAKWKVPRAVYQDCISNSITTDSPLPRWYLLINNPRVIIGCFGLIVNDFNSRQDLWPWLCALYVEEAFRGHAYGAKMLEHGKREAKRLGFGKLYLCTNHIGYYEKYGWNYIGDAYDTGGEPGRIYEISTK